MTPELLSDNPLLTPISDKSQMVHQGQIHIFPENKPFLNLFPDPKM